MLQGKKGFYHSIQTIGTLDGPGLRYVLFLQGCPFRCLFCHNPDTWTGAGKKIDVDYLVDDILKYKVFYETSNGGFTVSGGEPLLQTEFLTELFVKLKAAGVHTTVDTCGYVDLTEKLDRLVEVTDLFMLDIKHLNPEVHLKFTGKPNDKVLNFLNYLNQKKKKIWIRQVLVPGISMDDAYIEKLINFLKNYEIEKVELLPYHDMAKEKYEELKIDYPLKDTPVPPKAEVLKIRQKFLDNGFNAF